MSGFKKFFLLILILLLAFVVRIWQLDKNPPGFFCDEAANGFNAYKILITGKDEYGVALPFYFRSFGDYRNPVSIYSLIPVLAILGLSELSVRLTMAIYGTLTVLLVFLFTKELFCKEGSIIKTALPFISALFLAISPWHIHFSRTGFEFITLPFFLTLGLFLFFRFLNYKKNYLWYLGMASFIVTFYTYYPIQFVLPPFLIMLIFIFKKDLFPFKNRIFVIIGLLIFLIGLLPFLYGALSGKALTRFQSVSPLANKKELKEIAPSLAKTYLKHFSLDFLFTKGDVGMPGHFITRHSVRGIGELYLIQLPLLLTGFMALIFLKRWRLFSFFLIWFLLFPLGSTVVGEGPFAHRSIFGVIPFQILSAFGLVFVFSLKGLGRRLKIILGTIFILLILFSLGNYLNKYFSEYPSYSADFWGWQYGPRDTMKYFLMAKDKYDDLYMSGEFNAPEIFLKFYDPKNSCQNKCKIGDFWRNPQIINPHRRQLFSLSPEYLEKSGLKPEFTIKQTLYYPNGKIAFLIGEVFK